MEEKNSEEKNNIFIERRTERERQIVTNVEPMFAPDASIKGTISEIEPEKITISIETTGNEFVNVEQLLNKHFLVSFELNKKPVITPAASVQLCHENKDNLILKLYNINEHHNETIAQFIDEHGGKKEDDH